MNERLQELVEQCHHRYSEHHIDIEKFAELIVLEFEMVAKNPKWYDKSPSCGWRNSINHVCNVVKEHFGVK